MLSFCTAAAKVVLTAAGAPVRHVVRHAAHRAAVRHNLHLHQAAVRASVPHPGAAAPACVHAPGATLPAGPGRALLPGLASGPRHGGSGAGYVQGGASDGGAGGSGIRPGLGSLGIGSTGASGRGLAAAFSSPLAVSAGLLAGTLASGGLAAAAAFASRSAAPGQEAPIVPVLQLDLAAIAPVVFSMSASPAVGAGPVAVMSGNAADPGLAGPALLPNPVSVAEPASLALLGIGAAAAMAGRRRMRRR
jgi:hypothetical protein